MSSDKGISTGKDQAGERKRAQDDRQKRLAAALRDNLRRRKDRKRDRDGESDDGDTALGDAALEDAALGDATGDGAEGAR